MKVVQINTFGNLSTGRIAVDIYRTLKSQGHEGKIAFARNSIADDIPYIKVGNMFSVCLDVFMTRITGRAGFYSKLATKKLISVIEKYNPDIIHLHNLHGYYINIELLFEYLKTCGKPVVWTLHDCWSFTGHCCHYSMIECSKWKTRCHNCTQKKGYPASYVNPSKWNFRKKKLLFTSLTNMTLVAVSEWLAHEVKQSFMKDLPLEVIYNGIDISVFKPTISEFRKTYNLENRFIILGVASTWNDRKGLADFIKLADVLNDKNQIVLVGISKQDRKKLLGKIIGIPITDDIGDLAGIYTEADVLLNASVEETFGLPTVEAMACGTPVIVYDATALPEAVNSECGYVVKKHDLAEVARKINIIRESSPFEKLKLVEAAASNDKDIQYLKYLELYKRLLENK